MSRAEAQRLGARGVLVERGAFILLALGCIYAQLVPFSHAAGRWAAPDLLFCLAAAWLLRRPAVAPLLLVVAAGLMADILLHRPLGLGALGLLALAEVLGARRAGIRALGFVAECLAVAALFAAVLAGQSALLVLAFSPGPGLAPLAQHWLATALAYPLLVLAAKWRAGAVQGARS
ncbi:hypothetical protein BH23PSE1_BH23PSE1_06210 [soil metagenome]